MHTYAIIHTKYDALKSHSDKTTFFTRLYTCVMCVCVCVCMCMHVYTCIYVCSCVCICTRTRRVESKRTVFSSERFPAVFHHLPSREGKKRKIEKNIRDEERTIFTRSLPNILPTPSLTLEGKLYLPRGVSHAKEASRRDDWIGRQPG